MDPLDLKNTDLYQFANTIASLAEKHAFDGDGMYYEMEIFHDLLEIDTEAPPWYRLFAQFQHITGNIWVARNYQGWSGDFVTLAEGDGDVIRMLDFTSVLKDWLVTWIDPLYARFSTGPTENSLRIAITDEDGTLEDAFHLQFHQPTTVTLDGKTVDAEDAFAAMDRKIRDAILPLDVEAPFELQAFVDEYARRHQDRYGKPFTLQG